MPDQEVYCLPSMLDSAQRRAVISESGSLQIIAGPGSGKTTVLIERVLFLIHVQKVPPDRILVLTFSRKAAANLRVRFFARASEAGRDVVFGTFHSVFYHILTKYSNISYSLIDEETRRRLITSLAEEFYPGQDNALPPEELEKRLSQKEHAADPAVRMYFRYLEENRLMDYDRILRESLLFLSSGSESADRICDHYLHVLVDEFQDINQEQYSILNRITHRGCIFAIGDDDQTIYSFRGSDPMIMQQFMSDHPEAERIFLGTNYRCCHHIVRAGSKLISQNRLRISKELSASRKGGDKVSLLHFVSEQAEDRYLLAATSKLSDEEKKRAAVICRTNRQVQHFRRLFKMTDSNTAAIAAGNISAQKKLMEDVLLDLAAYLDLMCGIRSGVIRRESFYRVMNRPDRYLFRTLMMRDEETPSAMIAAAANRPPVLRSLIDLFDDCEAMYSMSTADFVRYLFDSMGYRKYIMQQSADPQGADACLSVIRESAAGAGDLTDLIRIVRDKMQRFSSGSENETEGVRVLTMHACKGLEFDRVYIPDINEGMIPSRRISGQMQMEEERRLLYVAMTRARDHLELLYITGTGSNPRAPSRFLSVYGVNSFVQ